MTAKEAIQTIKAAKAEVEWNYPLDYAAAFEVAIKAVEKQIPYKLEPIASVKAHVPVCGKCRGVMDLMQGELNYCPNCGQALDYYDEDRAREEIVELLKEHESYDDTCSDYYFYGDSNEERIASFLDDVMVYFDDELGLSSTGYELLSEKDDRIYEGSDDFGKEETGILDLYMLAFKLAQKRLKEESERK